jgi:hypothetical protein
MSEANNSNEEPAISTDNDQQAEDYGDEDLEDEVYLNNHDLIGIDGIIRAQKNEIEKKKLELRIENEKYFRSHPELLSLVQIFVWKTIDDRPENIL